MGTWYKVKDSFVEATIDYVDKIPTASISLINHKIGEREDDYNIRLANSNVNRYSLMDQKNVRCDLAKSVIEPCDIFTVDKQFIHVKKKTTSSTMSHLFSQGKIAGEAFLSDRKFRMGIRRNIIRENRISRDLIPTTNRVRSQEYEIIYAFIDKGDEEIKSSLPFFSLLNLKQSYHSLSLMGYKISVVKIKSE